MAERAAQVLQRVFGPEHAVLASTLALQARALLAQGEPVAAEPLLLRAMAIHTTAADSDDAKARTVELLNQARAGQARD